MMLCQTCFFNVLLPTVVNKFAEISSLAANLLSLAKKSLSLKNSQDKNRIKGGEHF